MSWEGWFTAAVVLVAVALMARDVVAPALTVLGADIALLVTGVIDPGQAFSGFSNPAPITVAALFVLARAVEKTGALQPMIGRALGNGNGGRYRLARLLVPTAAASAWLNNTPIVATLAPQVREWAEQRNQPPSWYLMPISFAAILGGAITVIGTSTNLVVSGLMQEGGLAPLGMFEITRVGLPVAGLGVLFLVLYSRRLLPDRRGPRRQFEEEIREYVVHMQVTPAGPLDGQTVEEGGLRCLAGVFLAEVEREGGEVVAPAAPSTRLRGGDRLIFAGRADMIRDLHSKRGLQPDGHPSVSSTLAGPSRTFFEVVVSAASPVAGKTLKEAEFRSRYQAAVLAIHRAGERVRSKLGEVRIREGDTLLLVADRGFGDRWRHRSEFLLVAHLGGSPPVITGKGKVVGAIALAVVVLAGAGVLPILHASLLGAIALVATGVLSPWEARESIELDIVLLIAASFGIGAAIQSSGLADQLAQGLVGAFASWGPWGVLLAIVVATLVLTELITNNAAAVLVFPVAMAAAAEVAASPRPFAIALTIAASASFLTPIGYQTNTMVFGMGGYRFTDFIRLGLPLTAVVLAAIMVFVPLFWPF